MHENSTTIRLILFLGGVFSLWSVFVAHGPNILQVLFTLLNALIAVGDFYFAFTLSRFTVPGRGKFFVWFLIGTFIFRCIEALVQGIGPAATQFVVGGLITWYLVWSFNRLGKNIQAGKPEKQSRRTWILVAILGVLVLGVLAAGAAIQNSQGI